jgi:hypothetical protein
LKSISRIYSVAVGFLLCSRMVGLLAPIDVAKSSRFVAGRGPARPGKQAPDRALGDTPHDQGGGGRSRGWRRRNSMTGSWHKVQPQGMLRTQLRSCDTDAAHGTRLPGLALSPEL